MRIAIIGAGRMGSTLAGRFTSAAHDVRIPSAELAEAIAT